MDRAWRGLLWKEWREQRWLLGFGCLMTTAVAAIGLRGRVFPDESLLVALAAVAVALLPVLATMSLVPAERANGTLAALLALPVAPRQVLAAKAAVGAVLSAAPLVAAGAVSLLLAGGREMASADVAGLFGGGAVAALSLYAWMFALAVRLPTEARAGLVAVGVLVAWMIVGTGEAWEQLPSWSWLFCPFALAPQVVPSAISTIPVSRSSAGAGWAAVAACQVVVAAALWVVSAPRFHASTEGRP